MISGRKNGRDAALHLNIWTANYRNGELTGVNKNLSINNDEYSVMHPSINKDGTRLYFSSNNPNEGFGGFDIYYVNLDRNGRPSSKPIKGAQFRNCFALKLLAILSKSPSGLDISNFI